MLPLMVSEKLQFPLPSVGRLATKEQQISLFSKHQTTTKRDRSQKLTCLFAFSMRVVTENHVAEDGTWISGLKKMFG